MGGQIDAIAWSLPPHKTEAPLMHPRVRLAKRAPADDHEPKGHMEATSAGTAKPRQARVSHKPNRQTESHATQRTLPPPGPAPTPMGHARSRRFSFRHKGMAQGGERASPAPSQMKQPNCPCDAPDPQQPATTPTPMVHARSTPKTGVRALQLSAERDGKSKGESGLSRAAR